MNHDETLTKFTATDKAAPNGDFACETTFEKRSNGSIVIWDMQYVMCSPEPKTFEYSKLQNPNSWDEK